MAYFKEIVEQHSRDNKEYETIRNSTISKDKFYEAEPDVYDNDMLDF